MHVSSACFFFCQILHGTCAPYYCILLRRHFCAANGLVSFDVCWDWTQQQLWKMLSDVFVFCSFSSLFFFFTDVTMVVAGSKPCLLMSLITPSFYTKRWLLKQVWLCSSPTAIHIPPMKRFWTNFCRLCAAFGIWPEWGSGLRTFKFTAPLENLVLSWFRRVVADDCVEILCVVF